MAKYVIELNDSEYFFVVEAVSGWTRQTVNSLYRYADPDRKKAAHDVALKLYVAANENVKQE